MSREFPTYSKEQIEKYFARIRLPPKHYQFNISSSSNEDALKLLKRLQKYQLSEVPFENLSMHYSAHRQVSLHPDELYRKIVESDGRGGYCMENNCVFGVLLRSLGFNLYSAGGRVNGGGKWGGW